MRRKLEARVIDPRHLELEEPIETPPGSRVELTITPYLKTENPYPGSGSELKPLLDPNPAEQPMLRIFAFGAPRVYRSDEEITSSSWRYAKTREMFFFLMCHPPCSREQIGLALWPEATPTHLRSSFRVALYHLRNALDHSEWIFYENGLYAFNHTLPYWFDVEVFKQQIADGRRLIAAGNSLPDAVRPLQTAVDLYRGEFLEGWNSSEWHYQPRQELEREYLEALLMLGQLYANQARYVEAGDMYRKVIAVDSYLETAHRELMRCYMRLGECGQALRHYRELRDMLQEELGAPPSPETQALYAELLHG